MYSDKTVKHHYQPSVSLYQYWCGPVPCYSRTGLSRSVRCLVENIIVTTVIDTFYITDCDQYMTRAGTLVTVKGHEERYGLSDTDYNNPGCSSESPAVKLLNP